MLKLLSEIGPVIAFFIGYKTGGILHGTLYMFVASCISIIVIYIKDRVINKVTLISTIAILISSSLTLLTGDSVFIKVKPTILYLVLAGIFFYTTKNHKPAVRYVLGHAIKLKEETSWLKLNIRFMWFFVFMAFLNEIIWRNFDEAIWVKFKVFGVLPVTILFIMLQMPFIIKEQKVND